MELMAKQRKKSKASSLSSPILNRRARFDYALEDDLVVGMELLGPEVRAARDHHVQLKGAFVSLKDGQLWLNNASFSVRINEQGQSDARTVDTRPRRLLATRKQIDEFAVRKQAGFSIVPTKLITAGHYIKLVIALGKGKKKYDKRQTLKKRAETRDIARELKSR